MLGHHYFHPGCKVPQKELLQLLEGVGSGLGMDSSIQPSKKYKDMFIVSTTDFFFPNVEDPYLQVVSGENLLMYNLSLRQGRIALANVLSDLYAMGVAEVDSVLMILAASLDMDESSRDIVARQFIKGFDGTLLNIFCALCIPTILDAANDAGTAVTGGQTVKNPWPIIGGVAKSVCREEDFIRYFQCPFHMQS